MKGILSFTELLTRPVRCTAPAKKDDLSEPSSNTRIICQSSSPCHNPILPQIYLDFTWA